MDVIVRIVIVPTPGIKTESPPAKLFFAVVIVAVGPVWLVAVMAAAATLILPVVAPLEVNVNEPPVIVPPSVIVCTPLIWFAADPKRRPVGSTVIRGINTVPRSSILVADSSKKDCVGQKSLDQ